MKLNRNKRFYLSSEWENVSVIEKLNTNFICRIFGYEFRFSLSPSPRTSRWKIKKYIENLEEYYKKITKDTKEELEAYKATQRWLINHLRNRGVDMYPVIQPSLTPDKEFKIVRDELNKKDKFVYTKEHNDLLNIIKKKNGH